MQLKDLGEFSSIINEVKKMGTIYELSSNSTKILSESFKDLSASQILAKVSTMGLTDAQKLELIEQFATDAANYSNVASTNALSASQVGATASTTGLSNAFKGLWAVMKKHPIISIAAGLTAVVGAVVGINKAIEKHNKELRESSTELTNAYKQEKSELQSLVDKYSELNEKLTSASLTTEEYESIKSELASIQDTLVTKYGEEANAIDVVNGKYDEQIEKLEKLSREKSADYVRENLKNVQSQRDFLNDSVKLSASSSATSAYINYIKDLEGLSVSGQAQKDAPTKFTLNYKYEGTPEEIRSAIEKDMDILISRYGESNEDVNKILSQLSGMLDNEKVNASAIEQAYSDSKEFARAKIVSDVEINNAYEALTKGVEDYNTALENGEGIDEAKANLEELKSSFNSATEGITDANLVYDELLSKINRPLDIKNQMGDLGNNQTYKNALDKLSEIESDTLKSFNYQEAIDSVSGLTLDSSLEAFGQLIKLLNISEDEVQTLINLLIELGFVQDSAIIQNEQNFKNKLGFNQNANNATDAKRNLEINDFYESLGEEDRALFLNAEIPDEVLKGNIKDWKTHLEELRKMAELDVEIKVNPTTSIANAKEAFSDFDSIYDEIMGDKTVSADSIDGLTENFGELNGGLALEHFRNVLTTMPDDIDAQKQALNDLATVYLDQTELMQNLTEENKDYVISELEKIGVENAEEYVINRLSEETQQLLNNLFEFSKVYQDNYDAIKHGTKGNEEYEKSLQNVKQSLEDMFAYEIDDEQFTFNLSDDFVENNFEDIEAAANGSIDALNRLRVAASKDAVMNVGINAPTEAMAEGVRQQINSLIDGFNINDVEVGTCLDDTPLIQGLNHLVDAGTITRDSMNKILAGIGVEPEHYHQTVTIETPTYDAKTGAYSRKPLQIKIPAIRYNVVSKGSGARYVSPSGSSSSSGGGGGGGGSSSSANETSETFDWVETKITRLEEAIARLDKTVGNTYDNWSNRNSALSQEMSKVREEIDLQQQAYNRYIEEANNVGLSPDYVDKIKNGKLDIQTIKDQATIDKINQYTEWYNKAVACDQAIQDLNITLGDLAQQSFDNITQEYSDFISLIEGSADIIDERINRVEEQGYFASSSYYSQMLNYESQEMARLKEEYNKLINQREAAVDSGAILKGSEAYQAMTQEIQGVQQAIEESATATVELNNAIRDLNWEIFDYIEERIGKITEESNFLIDLLDNQSLYNDNGSFNNRGQSAAYLHGKNAQIYAQQVKDYANEIKKINADLAKDPSNKTLIERREELLDLQQESISNIYAEKEAVKSLVEEGINKHLESLSELIDKYKESMNSAKD